MRRVALALLLFVSTAQASATIPPRFTQQPADAAAAQLEKLRAMKGTRDVDVTMYMSEDGTQLTLISWQMKLDYSPTRSNLEAFERGVVKGASKSASKHVSDSQRFEGDQLVGDAIDEIMGLRVHQRRRYGIDGSGVVHIASMACTGAAGADDMVACENALQTLSLTVPNAAAIKEAPDIYYKIGYVVGAAIPIALLVWLVVWLDRRSRRKQREKKQS